MPDESHLAEKVFYTDDDVVAFVKSAIRRHDPLPGYSKDVHERLYRQVLLCLRSTGALPVPTTLFDMESFRFALWNKACEKLYGFTADEVCVADPSVLPFVPEDDVSLAHMSEMVAKRKPFHVGLTYRLNKAGMRVPIELYGVPVVDDGVVIGAITSTRDLTREAEIAERENQTIERLERVNEEVDLVARAASHDLQVPLRMIHSFADLAEMSIEDNEEDVDLKEISRLLREIKGAAKSTQAALSGIADIASQKSVSYQIRPRDATAFIGSLIESQSLIIADAGGRISADLETGLVAEFDDLKIERAFWNLINNCISYRSTDPLEIVVKLKVAKDPSFVLISIIDNGIGLGDNDDPNLLKAIFSRGSNQSARVNRDPQASSGIGLGVTTRIIEIHGGELTIEHRSDGKRGTAVSFTLPVGSLSSLNEPVT